MNNPPFSLVAFLALSFIFFILRNIFYLRLWKFKREISTSGLFTSVFPKGYKKMMEPIVLKEKIENIEIIGIIKKVNVFSKLLIASIFLSVLLSIIELLFL